MTHQEFDYQFQRLATEWPNSFKAAKMDLLWTRVEHRPAEAMEKAVDRILEESKYAPPIAEVLHAVNQYRRHHVPGGPCTECGGSLWISIQSPSRRPLVKRCSCVGGPEALAISIRNHSRNPDPELADGILGTPWTSMPRYDITQIPKTEAQERATAEIIDTERRVNAVCTPSADNPGTVDD